MDKEAESKIINLIELGIESTGQSDEYSTGFCNALVWIKSCITGEEPKFFEVKERKNDK